MCPAAAAARRQTEDGWERKEMHGVKERSCEMAIMMTELRIITRRRATATPMTMDAPRCRVSHRSCADEITGCGCGCCCWGEGWRHYILRHAQYRRHHRGCPNGQLESISTRPASSVASAREINPVWNRDDASATRGNTIPVQRIPWKNRRYVQVYDFNPFKL